MRILLTGGGTAGHINPIIAIIEQAKLRTKNSELRVKNLEFLYIGSKTGMERDLVKNVDIPFKAIYTGKLRRYFSFENFFDIFKLFIGVFQSLYYVNKFKPDIVFSKGGFVSVPVIFASFLLRKKIILHESDITIGLANRICSFFATEILLGNEESKKFFPKKQIKVTGTPIRSFILNGDKENARKILKFTKDKKVLLIMGGSLGAKAINEVVFESLDELTENFNIIHITGKNPQSPVPSTQYPSYRPFEYVSKDLPDFYALADIIVSRAGANTLAEISSLNKKSLLIPLPGFASRGDQIINAEFFVKKHQAELLMQEDLNKSSFLKKIEILNKLEDSKHKASIHINAADKVLDEILNFHPSK